jgi:hypothetical protein
MKWVQLRKTIKKNRSLVVSVVSIRNKQAIYIQREQSSIDLEAMMVWYWWWSTYCLYDPSNLSGGTATPVRTQSFAHYYWRFVEPSLGPPYLWSSTWVGVGGYALCFDKLRSFFFYEWPAAAMYVPQARRRASKQQ